MTENVYSNLPKLYIVGTPIGNLQDMSTRAISVLKSCDLILAEDTRHSIYLMQHFDIKVPLQSYHQHNELGKSAEVLQLLQQNKTIALISDAGMPLISDPGYYLVKMALEHGIKVSVVPGPSALTSAISISGIDCSKFCFEGFLPSKESSRNTVLNDLAFEHRAMVFYEAPHRLLKALDSFKMCFSGQRKITVLKELTKQYEKIYHGDIDQVIEKIIHTQQGSIKGEYVIVVEGCAQQAAPEDEVLISALKICLDEGLSTNQSSKLIAKLYQANKNQVYELALKLK